MQQSDYYNEIDLKCELHGTGNYIRFTLKTKPKYVKKKKKIFLCGQEKLGTNF